MAILNDHPIRDRATLVRFEAALTLAQRLPERSVLDVFIGAAARQPERTAITLLITGAPDEQPRRVTYAQLLGMVRGSANLFASIGGPRPGVAYMLPSLVETHATLWGAETAGYAVPINFLLQVEHIAALLEASGARILVALGPHPVLDIWSKALELRERVPGLTLICVAPSDAPIEEGVINFHTALTAQPDDRLVFGESGQDNDVAAYFHTGGTTGTPKLVAHTHRGQLTAALGGAAMSNFCAEDVATATLPLFHVFVEAIPMTAVGKIFKPELRCDAAARVVKHMLHEQLQLADAQVHVSAGGPRGMRVSVSLPRASQAVVPTVEKLLGAYLFESRVQVV